MSGVADHLPDRELRERPVAELVKEFASHTSTLVRQEMELAKAEMTHKGKQAAVAGAMFGGAALAAFLALGVLTVCLVAALATAMHVWLAALIVAAAYAAVGAGLAFTGRTRVRNAAPPVPEQTIETVKEDVQWAKTLRSSAAR